MRLLHKTGLIYLGIMLPLLVGLGFALSKYLIDELEEDALEQLWQKKVWVDRVWDQVPVDEFELPGVSLERSDRPNGDLPQPVVSDTMIQIWEEQEVEDESVKQIRYYLPKEGRVYRLTIWQEGVDRAELYGSIYLALGAAALGLALLGSLLIGIISQRLWKPFFQTLSEMERFSLRHPRALGLQESSTAEFKRLNRLFAEMAELMLKDYRNLREFTENASHEIQTPLAVIQQQLEVLSQSPQLGSSDAQAIATALRSLRGLSRLTQDLLMLSKIENAQFDRDTEVRLDTLLREELTGLSALADAQGIELHWEVEGPCIYRMNASLAKVLIGNLFRNAVKHNVPEGKLRLRFAGCHLEVWNSGTDHPLEETRIYERFYKGKAGEGSSGLGLALVKSICDDSGIRISYRFENEMHGFLLDFPPQEVKDRFPSDFDPNFG